MAHGLGQVVAVCISERTGEQKKAVDSIQLVEDYGIVGDAHGGTERQVSLLAKESIDTMRAKGLTLADGDFAENIVTSGVDLLKTDLGTRIEIADVVLEVTQIGKTCHQRCAIYHQAGDCVMPTQGIFVKVIEGGAIRSGDEIHITYP
ncbi:MOSC domain-containing protein [Desulfuromonas acetoxidans]|uniref:MOSC domain protein n=1 Tax=Desulfuromonas acetoxidans (strain DSM 684 / 11070) TaxID=281689 RepID=Q1JVC2_DESA6|nr:MOSC domain-containing protein [Desulfuromonas acetoxidans]EAT14192.1 MOSC domain protein [Desulfuromonas acetoxidans DSM 684]MBF0644850.1 MOSC domain-containing protein [Desulfuromonas acetoxidans]NVD23617.1 MOSC domain-containing protein [Desulfuromonas acetoxidans]NVE15998.1 MOSC domain-containing protein [Desulfuromonas acetoxidans]